MTLVTAYSIDSTVQLLIRPLAAQCAYYRSLLVRTPTAYTRSGQSECHISPAPIRTSERSSRVLFTQSRVTTEHEHRSGGFFSKYAFLSHFSVFGYCAILIWGDRGIAGGLFVEQTDPLQIRREMCCFQAIYALPLHPHLRSLGSNDFCTGEKQ